jgi:hypothetical protein
MAVQRTNKYKYNEQAMVTNEIECSATQQSQEKRTTDRCGRRGNAHRTPTSSSDVAVTMTMAVRISLQCPQCTDVLFSVALP